MTNKNEILWKNSLLKDIVWNFVRKGVRCDASNRLLRNSSRERPDDGIRVPCSSRWWVGEFILLTENTCSEYRIPPQNTPIVLVQSNNKNSRSIEQKQWGYFVMGSGTPYPPTPQKNFIFFPIFSHFFPDFSRIFWDFWGFPY